MGNRAHRSLLDRHPWLSRRARGQHADGPDVAQKRLWNRKWRARMRTLLHGVGTQDPPPHDPDATSYPKRAGNRSDWY